MYDGEAVMAELRCDNSLMRTMIDRFGEEIYHAQSFLVRDFKKPAKGAREMDRILRSSLEEAFPMVNEEDKGAKASLLKELYDGKFAPAEQICPADPGYWRLCREAGQEEEDIVSIVAYLFLLSFV